MHLASYIENDCSVIETGETDQKYNRNKSLIYCYHHPFEFMLFVSLYSFFIIMRVHTWLPYSRPKSCFLKLPAVIAPEQTIAVPLNPMSFPH